MGRIADALKKAQDERARRIADRGADDDAHGTGDSRLFGRSQDFESRHTNAGTDVLSHSLIAEAPPAPRPFPVQGPPILPDNVPLEVVAFHDPSCAIAERYRSARTRLMTANPTGSSRVFAVTSSLQQEGKTTTVANLAFSLGELRHLRVAMVDLDFRQRGLSRRLGLDEQPGMAEVLRGERRLAEVCLPFVRENLFIVPAGNPEGANPSELISAGHASGVFKELNERFHYTLVDTPPVNSVADIGMVAPMCHSVILVIRMNHAPEPLLRRCVKLLQANHVSIAGCLLAGYDERTMGYADGHDVYGTG